MATLDQIAKTIKKLGSADSLPSVPAVARELGEDLDGKFVGQVYQAEPVAFPELKIKSTEAAVRAARQSGLRFERIAVRSGLTVGQVKAMAEKTGTGSDFYTGRGRKPGNGNGSSASTKSATATSGRRGTKTAAAESKTGTSGRRGKTAAAKKTTATAKTATRGRRGTRAAANPK